jgi:hypothetical protein
MLIVTLYGVGYVNSYDCGVATTPRADDCGVAAPPLAVAPERTIGRAADRRT